jgi:hypothetical protein
MNATAESPQKIVFRLRLQTTADEDHVRRLRQALKLLLRKFGLRCIDLEQEQDSRA